MMHPLNPTQDRNERQAFTLIEMLVVISIIALLIAIIQPSLGQARENARRAVCGSQLRQHGVAMIAYANDNRQKYPLPTVTTNWPDGAMTSNWAIADSPAGQTVLFAKKYLNEPLVFYCPSNKHAQSNWASLATGWRPNDWRQTYIHYPYWANFRSAYDTAGTLPRVVAEDVTSPASRVIASDNITVDAGPAHANSISRNHLGAAGKPAGGNVLLNDSSAQWRSFEATTLRVSIPFGAPHQRDFHF